MILVWCLSLGACLRICVPQQFPPMSEEGVSLVRILEHQGVVRLHGPISCVEVIFGIFAH